MPKFKAEVNKDQYDEWYKRVGDGVCQPLQRNAVGRLSPLKTRILLGIYRGETTGTGYVLVKENNAERCVGSLNVSAMEARAGEVVAP